MYHSPRRLAIGVQIAGLAALRAADSVGSMADASLPSGTVTFVFSDIDGSTNLLRQLRDDYALLLDHARLLGAAIDRNDGHLVDTQGDAVFAVFPPLARRGGGGGDGATRTCGPPVAAGVDLRVRMGLHTGEPLVEGERYVGLAVHRGRPHLLARARRPGAAVGGHRGTGRGRSACGVRCRRAGAPSEGLRS